MPQDPLLHPSAYNHHPHPSRAQAAGISPSLPTPLVPSTAPFAASTDSPMHGVASTLSTPPKDNAHSLGSSPISPGTPKPVRAMPGSAGSGSGVVGLGATGSGTIKDVIPISKTPRKQRSSRFVVNEHIELEHLPGLAGASIYLIYAAGFASVNSSIRSLTQRFRHQNDMNYSCKNFINVQSYSISTMLLRR